MAFEKMRRIKQELEESEITEILLNNTSGVLSVLDENGYPYAVPLSYVYKNGKIYFHSAKSGHKINAIKNCYKATFCVVDKDEVQPQLYTTIYRSVIAFGSVKIVEDGEEVLFAMRQLGEKYYPNHDAELNAEINKFKNAFLVLAFEIEHITGKQAKELIRNT